MGGSTPSSIPPRRQAARRPMNVPSTKARIVVTPISPSVHGRACPTWCMTESGKKVSDVPRRSRAMFQRYAK